ncbi:MAG: hypothetical protein KOO66_08915 [Bacteroidales bacterium]|nr:hypothetical protein [Bacteroidales bacterium]
MKKILIPFAIILMSAGVLFNSCDRDDSPLNVLDCAQLLTDYSQAASAFSADPSTENCNTLKNAIVDYLAEDCVALTTALRAELQSELEDLPCY